MILLRPVKPATREDTSMQQQTVLDNHQRSSSGGQWGGDSNRGSRAGAATGAETASAGCRAAAFTDDNLATAATRQRRSCDQLREQRYINSSGPAAVTVRGLAVVIEGIERKIRVTVLKD